MDSPGSLKFLRDVRVLSWFAAELATQAILHRSNIVCKYFCRTLLDVSLKGLCNFETHRMNRCAIIIQSKSAQASVSPFLAACIDRLPNFAGVQSQRRSCELFFKGLLDDIAVAMNSSCSTFFNQNLTTVHLDFTLRCFPTSKSSSNNRIKHRNGKSNNSRWFSRHFPMKTFIYRGFPWISMDFPLPSTDHSAFCRRLELRSGWLLQLGRLIQLGRLAQVGLDALGIQLGMTIATSNLYPKNLLIAAILYSNI